ncbi:MULTISPECIES: PRC-barrel domain containing protein [Alteromonadaceae]|uniref:PRC-barrel domain containing protein n=1 Tax=Brumicola blandensis TaxID=3075611 RepID=A0AAW8QVN5_9ALTE|nr:MULTISPECIES: PRC-barrel domain containing protein [unclassified Alteromonas]MDT0581086.1 PRC-barrel domain containing protein [Alteromonas sp. W409]MDT0629487.1 PRC-barrel domain containing protein [Alteromonas sp. W364]
MLISLNEVLSFVIKANNGTVGKAYDLLIDDRSWTSRFLVADTNTWMPMSHKALISPVALDELNIQGEEVLVSISKEQVKAAPSADSETPVSREFEKAYFDYFGYGYYWIGPSVWGDHAYPTALADDDVASKKTRLEEAEEETRHNHLRSIREIMHYGIIATDGAKGHVYDFILDTYTWSLDYIVVDTRDWLPGGKKVLMLPSQFSEISWSSQALMCDLTLEQVRACPEYKPESLNELSYLESVRHSLSQKVTSLT